MKTACKHSRSKKELLKNSWTEWIQSFLRVALPGNSGKEMLHFKWYIHQYKRKKSTKTCFILKSSYFWGYNQSFVNLFYTLIHFIFKWNAWRCLTILDYWDVTRHQVIVPILKVMAFNVKINQTPFRVSHEVMLKNTSTAPILTLL